MIEEFTADQNFERLDLFLSNVLEISRSKASKLIDGKNVKSDRRLKPSSKVLRGQKFIVEIPKSINPEILEPQNIDFEVVYEDEYLLIVNKPSGLVVHPAVGNYDKTLVNGLVYRYPEMLLMNDKLRPGIVHRLDKGTSGLMVVAKDEKTQRKLKEIFRDRKVNKEYIALVHGKPKQNEAIISGTLNRDPDNRLKISVVEGGKISMTGYKVLWNINNISMVLLKLFTGRTHQIRAHFSALGCPLVGDVLYGAVDEGLNRVFLHSWKLEFNHPSTGQAMRFIQPVTEDFIKYVDIISKSK